MLADDYPSIWIDAPAVSSVPQEASESRNYVCTVSFVCNVLCRKDGESSSSQSP